MSCRIVQPSIPRGRDGFFVRVEGSTITGPLFGESISHRLRGIFHNELAISLSFLGKAERRADYTDRALLEYTAAVYHAEQASREMYVGRIENNLAFLLYKLGRYADAHEHFDRAQMVFTRLRDAGSLAQVDETRARVLVAERRYRDAERTLASALKTLEQGDESGGSVTKAARLLGLTHQTLISILTTRHKALSEKRKAPQKRLKSIIKKTDK
jgi:tetratricopeptide (TPR) repeat protein